MVRLCALGTGPVLKTTLIKAMHLGKKHQLPKEGSLALLKREILPVPCLARPPPDFARKCSTQWNMLSCILKAHGR